MRSRTIQAAATSTSAPKRARASATGAMPITGTAMRMKMYCSDQISARPVRRAQSWGRTPLQVHALHRIDGVARPGACADRGSRGDSFQIRLRKSNVQTGQILIDALLALGAGDGNEVLALREQPGE